MSTGSPLDRRIFLSPPHAAGAEFEYLRDAFEKNWIAPVGPDIGRFEAALAKRMEGRHVAALSSGTAALHLALVLLGVKQGDEVLVSSFTFSASANPIVYQGATPVFIDAEPFTWNLNPELLEEAIISRREKGHSLKAVIAVHLYGMPCQLDRILEICARHQIPLVEDAAEALGSRYRNKNLGSFGVLGALSFNGNKIITTSGGGALVSEDEDLVARARYLATQARDPAPHYQHSTIGYNYRLSNLLAAFGRGQLEKLDWFVQRRRENYEFYRRRLSGLAGLSFPSEPSPDYFANRWLTTMLVNPSNANGKSWMDIHAALDRKGIEARPLWKPLHMQPVFADCPAFVNGTAERLFNQGICLPSGTALKREELEEVADTVEEVLYSAGYDEAKRTKPWQGGETHA